MTQRNDGGPAFPVTLNPGESYQEHSPFDGMTLRDYFAAKAMQAFLGNDDAAKEPARDLARASYQMADCMLAARERT